MIFPSRLPTGESKSPHQGSPPVTALRNSRQGQNGRQDGRMPEAHIVPTRDGVPDEGCRDSRPWS